MVVFCRRPMREVLGNYKFVRRHRLFLAIINVAEDYSYPGRNGAVMYFVQSNVGLQDYNVMKTNACVYSDSGAGIIAILFSHTTLSTAADMTEQADQAPDDGKSDESPLEEIWSFPQIKGERRCCFGRRAQPRKEGESGRV